MTSGLDHLGFDAAQREGHIVEADDCHVLTHAQPSVAQRDGKKIYTVTDEGRKFLEENRRSIEDIWGRVDGGWDPDMASEIQEIRHEVIGLGKRFGREMHGGQLDSDKLRRVREVISSAVREIEDILDERGESSGETDDDAGGGTRV